MDITLLGMVVLIHPAIKVFDEVSMMALQSLRESYCGLSLSTLIDVRPLQPLMASCSIDVTLFGILMEVRPLLEKANWPMDVTLLGIMTEVRPLQL